MNLKNVGPVGTAILQKSSSRTDVKCCSRRDGRGRLTWVPDWIHPTLSLSVYVYPFLPGVQLSKRQNDASSSVRATGRIARACADGMGTPQ